MTDNKELACAETTEVIEQSPQLPTYQPRVEIWEGPEALTLLVEMPGVSEDHVDVILDQQKLTVRGQVETVTHDGFEIGHSEYADGNYERTFKLNTEIDREQLEARMKDGVLTIHLPRAEKVGETKIKVIAG